jgi:hypothetical protein
MFVSCVFCVLCTYRPLRQADHFFKLMCIYSYIHTHHVRTNHVHTHHVLTHHVHLLLYQVTCIILSGYIKHKLFPFLGGEQSELGWRGFTFK